MTQETNYLHCIKFSLNSKIYFAGNHFECTKDSQKDRLIAFLTLADLKYEENDSSYINDYSKTKNTRIFFKVKVKNPLTLMRKELNQIIHDYKLKYESYRHLTKITLKKYNEFFAEALGYCDTYPIEGISIENVKTIYEIMEKCKVVSNKHFPSAVVLRNNIIYIAPDLNKL